MAEYEIIPLGREKYMFLSDFVIKTESKEIKCHKLKLAWNSDVFSTMLQQEDCNENQRNKLVIEDFSNDTIEDFVAFLYDGKLEDESKFTTQLLAMAHKYQVKSMMDTCSNYLSANVTKDNVSQVWLVSKACEFPKLAHAVHVFLADNWKSKDELTGIVDVIKSHPEYMVDLMSYIIQKQVEGVKAEKENLKKEMDEANRVNKDQIKELNSQLANAQLLSVKKCGKCANEAAYFRCYRHHR